MLNIRKYLVVMVLLVSSQFMSIEDAEAQYCDACVAAAVATTTAVISSGFTAVTAELQLIVTELNYIGLAVQQLIEGNATGFASINQTLIEIARIEVNEAHLLAEKEATLRIKRDINDKFGSVSEDLCYEVETTSGAIAGSQGVEAAVKNTIDAYVGELHATTRGAGRRSSEILDIPPTIKASDYVAGDVVASEEMLANLPKMIVALTESEEYEAPKEPTPFSSLSASEKEYKQRYLTRQWNLQIVQDAVRSTIQDQSIPTKPAGEWVATKLADAGINPSGYVNGAMTTKSGVIQAVGHAEFGNQVSQEKSGLVGDELLKKQIQMIGQSNYLLAENWKIASETKLLTALLLAKETEEHYEEDMVKGLLNSDR